MHKSGWPSSRKHKLSRHRMGQTYIITDDKKAVGVLKVEGEWLAGVEGELYLCEGLARILGSKDDASRHIGDRDVHREDHLQQFCELE